MAGGSSVLTTAIALLCCYVVMAAMPVEHGEILIEYFLPFRNH
jgi:hypothetical protein